MPRKQIPVSEALKAEMKIPSREKWLEKKLLGEKKFTIKERVEETGFASSAEARSRSRLVPFDFRGERRKKQTRNWCEGRKAAVRAGVDGKTLDEYWKSDAQCGKVGGRWLISATGWHNAKPKVSRRRGSAGP